MRTSFTFVIRELRGKGCGDESGRRGINELERFRMRQESPRDCRERWSLASGTAFNGKCLGSGNELTRWNWK
jgi:hypothetical protein